MDFATRFSRQFTLFLFFILTFLVNITGEEARQPLTVTFCGNSGFILESGNTKIAVDAMFSGYKGRYETPRSQQNLMKKAKAPYHNIDLILVTHSHADHVKPGLVADHLKKSSKTVLAGTGELAGRISELVAEASVSPERIIAVDIGQGEEKTIKLQRISVKAVRLQHGTNFTPNLGYLININGWKIIHLGDSYGPTFNREMSVYKIKNEKFDIALIPFWYLNKKKSAKVIQFFIKTNKIIPIHLSLRDSPVPLSREIARIRANFAKAWFFSRELEKKIFR